MEKISFEMIISALFDLGFDKVDPVLFTYALSKLTMEDNEHQFVYEEQGTSIGFNKYVDDSGVAVKLRDGYTLDTNVRINDSVVMSVRDTLFSNKKLLSCLESLDFNEVVSNKAGTYGITNFDNISTDYFCKKEINILHDVQNCKSKKLKLTKYK